MNHPGKTNIDFDNSTIHPLVKNGIKILKCFTKKDHYKNLSLIEKRFYFSEELSFRKYHRIFSYTDSSGKRISKRKKPKKNNRDFDKVISVRLNESQYKKLCENVEKSGMTQAQFCKQAITVDNIKIIDKSVLKRITTQLRVAGSNINQISKQANQSKNVTLEMISKIDVYYERLEKQWELLRAYLAELQ